jgi:ABC-type sugar transport system ATPase subunit
LNIEIQDKEFLVLVGPSRVRQNDCFTLFGWIGRVTEGKIFIGDRLVMMSPRRIVTSQWSSNHMLYTRTFGI